MAVVFSNIEKAFAITWHFGLLFELSELAFFTSPIKLSDSFLSERKFSLDIGLIFYVQRSSGKGCLTAPSLLQYRTVYITKRNQ
jgi:hypothetical protein